MVFLFEKFHQLSRITYSIHVIINVPIVLSNLKIVFFLTSIKTYEMTKTILYSFAVPLVHLRFRKTPSVFSNSVYSLIHLLAAIL